MKVSPFRLKSLSTGLPILALAGSLLTISSFSANSAAAETWRSELYPENWQRPSETASFYNDKLIQDFSYAGYRRGEEAIPAVTGPVFNVSDYGADPTGTSDSTLAIQAAIDAAAAAGGGVVLMPAGEFKVSPGPEDYCLRINSSNIVLRGAGTTETFLLNTDYRMRSKTVILVRPETVSVSGAVAITADIPGPTRRIPVSNASSFSIGDTVRIEWIFTADWIAEHNQQAYWSATSGPGDARYYREVVATNPAESWIEVDVPTRYSIKRRDRARVFKVNGMLSQVGLESFSIGNVQHPGDGWAEGDYLDPTKAAFDTHGSWLVRYQSLRDSWISNIHSRQATENTTTSQMLANGISLVDCVRNTVSDSEMRRPQYGGGGGNGYMFRLQYTNDSLVQNSVAEFSRHGFVVSHAGTSGNVFHRCEDRDTGRAVGSSPAGYNTGGSGSDNHMHFSHSNLWDQCHAHNSFWTAHHRQNSGTVPHGLTSAHAVYWNTSGSGTRYPEIVRSEQARYGYVIGTSGTQSGASNTVGGNTAPADHLEGLGSGDILEPQSLFLDQRARRLEPTVTYVANGAMQGQAPIDANNPYQPGATATVLGAGTLQRTNYDLVSWNTEPDGSGTTYQQGDTFNIEGSTILYAQWVGAEYLVSFDANGGSAPTASGLQVQLGTPYGDLPLTELPGSIFVGWFTALSGGDLVTPLTPVEINANHTLYARWNALPVVNAGPSRSLTFAEPSPWTPAQISTQAWFDAADAASLTVVEGTVSQWNDKSTNDNHVSQAELANRPTFGTVTIGGMETVSFRALAKQFLEAPDHPSLALDSTGGVNIFAVANFHGFVNQGSGLNVPFSKGQILGASAAYGIRVSNSNGLSFKAASNLMYSSPGTIKVDMVYSGLRDDSTGIASMFYNGSLQGSVSKGGALVSDNTDPLYIGRDSSNARFTDVDFGEILLVSSALSDLERQRIEGYLAHKWNLDALLNNSHPFKNAPPALLGSTTLQGSASDSDSDTLTHSWTLVSGPAQVVFDTPNSLTTRVTFPLTGIYVIRLTSSDEYSSSSSDVVIAASENFVPVAYAIWAGNLDFYADTNSDGIADGAAWLLGAASPSEHPDSLLQANLLQNGEVEVTFSMLNQPIREGFVVEIQYSSDLSAWSAVTVPDNSARIDDIDFIISPDGDFNHVRATFPSGTVGSNNTEFFIRLIGR